jgi:hypothetical protein
VRYADGGSPMVGILHSPAASICPGRRAGVLVVNSGLRPRTGPYRLYVRVARRLCAAGLYVLRMDFPGIGDSPGHFADASAFRRQFVDNTELTRRVAGFFRSEWRLDSLGLCGLCTGAINALVTTAAEPSVDFGLLFSLPVDPLQDLSGDAAAQFALRLYVRKLFRWQAWRNLFLLRSNFSVMRRAVAQLVRPRHLAQPIDESIWDAFSTVALRGGKLLFVYGEHDPIFHRFRGEFSRRLSKTRDAQKACFAVEVVAAGNHVFAQAAAQRAVAERSAAFVQGLFAAKQAAAPAQCPSATERPA